MGDTLNRLPARDRLFLVFLGVAAAILVLFTIGVVVLGIFTNPSETVSLRVLTVFSAMFSGWLGTVTGYLLGRGGNGNGNGDNGAKH